MKKSTPSKTGKALVKATPVRASSAALVAMPKPDSRLDRAGRANFFHTLSREAGVVAIRAALAAGVELLQAKEELSGGFQKWVESKCAFSVGTAYRYMRLVQASLPEAALPKLLAGSGAQREREIEEVASSTDSRTLTELYDDLGIVRKTPSNLGGARPGAGRPRLVRDGESLSNAALEAWNNVLSRIVSFCTHSFDKYLPAEVAEKALQSATLLRDALASRVKEAKAARRASTKSAGKAAREVAS